jgi:hypothetical protein
MLDRQTTHRVRAIFALMLALPLLACAQTPQDIDTARDIIWAKEQAIYQGRSEGDLSNYLNNTSNQYVGWPPGAKVPADLTGLKAMAKSVAGLNQERLQMELADFAMSGNTAVIYYHTHRTVSPKGESVDQRYAICHVWVREGGEWKLIGAHGRLKSANEIREPAAGS